MFSVAANGYLNLDDPTLDGKFSRDRDSGAIYAGAANPLAGTKADFSDYGSRVDLFSWGELNILQCKYVYALLRLPSD